MTITDDMLARAAPEAAERWLSTLPERENCEHSFSPAFEASMQSLLRRRKRRWRTVLLLAAVIAALAALLASGAYAGQPDSYRVYAAQEDGLISFSARPKDSDVKVPFRALTPGWVPEGFVLGLSSNDLQKHAAFSYYSTEDPDGRYFALEQWHGEEQHAALAGNFTLEDMEVDGIEAILIYNEDTLISYLVWIQGTDVFLLRAKGLDREELLHIADNMKW